MRRLLAPITALALLTTATACGGSSDEPATDTEGGLAQVAVGIIPIIDVAPIYLGQEQGFFEERGIELELVPGSGGAAAVPGVVAGDFDFAFGNVTSLLLAQTQGLPLQVVSNGTASTGDPETDFSAVVVPADSPVQTAADLAGKTVAVNNFKNIGEVTIRKAVEDAGGDSSTVNFVELPFPDMPAAVANGNVDAAWVVEPFVTVATGQGARAVVRNFAEPVEDLTVATYFTTEQMLAENPDLVDDFQAAMNESLQYAQDNPDELRRIITTYTSISPEVAGQIALPSFPEEINVESMETVAELMAEYGITEETADVDALLATD
ncbi:MULTISPECIES: ABC transporter substrate-binding protein [unclassified Modestobacter]|uniref:ABC transporter substrate-binding protein n=1 Tax=unclassified Modestobacter TaxID=2643866 RepID=UPI0022AA909F|nr:MULTISPECIES: ABC transporter substrate-binding protein [unclassified Modestobacter]MCZ2812593.1 ABC transporter substrate-binding protein [Modestobacter sp. VKM Ac-2979]MCZ2841483.1 ABC transporter substrate-binding protein [Modestobacter sp. VKM Ac-2980]MCZ2850800.1 ABC transporter substrate-binding protein [Modestobacter sp. VKM Ac-2978]